METFYEFFKKRRFVELSSLGLFDADKGGGPQSTHPISKYTKGEDTYFVKFSRPSSWAEYSVDLQTIIEYLAYKIYELYGVKVPQSYLVANEKADSIGIATRGIEGAQATGLQQLKKHADITAGFFVDVLLANWDVMGLAWDNIMVTDTGDAYRIDPGGAMTYRAQGERKGQQFGTDPSDPQYGELSTMRGKNPMIQTTASQFYKDLSDDEMKGLGVKFKSIPWEALSGVIEKAKQEALAKTEELTDAEKKSRLANEINQDFDEIQQKMQQRHAKIVDFIDKLLQT
jgi:hypothetical protein